MDQKEDSLIPANKMLWNDPDTHAQRCKQRDKQVVKTRADVQSEFLVACTEHCHYKEEKKAEWPREIIVLFYTSVTYDGDHFKKYEVWTKEIKINK